MAARPITDDLDYTLCRNRGNPSHTGGIEELGGTLDQMFACDRGDPSPSMQILEGSVSRQCLLCAHARTRFAGLVLCVEHTPRPNH